MKKYRIKLKNGRSVGPFTKEQIGELYLKSHIDGLEDCQSFPVGDWKKIDDFPEISKLIVDIISKKVSLDSLREGEKDFSKVKHLGKIRKTREQEKVNEGAASKSDDFNEFKFDKEEEFVVDYDEIEKKYEAGELEEQKETKKRIEDVEATRLIRRKSIPKFSEDDEIAKTTIINLKSLKEELEEEEDIADDPEEEDESEEKVEEVSFDEKTEFINLDSLLPSIKEEVETAEQEIIEQEELERKIEEEKIEKEVVVEKEEVSVKKKAMKPVVALAFIVIIYSLLFPDDDLKDVTIVPKRALIKMPIAFDQEDPLASESAFEKGLEAYGKGTYLAKIVASSYFKKSLEYKMFGNDKALGHLILSYAEVYENATSKDQAKNVLVNLIKLARAKTLTDVNIAMGTSLFYLKSGKELAALNTLENFLRVKKKPSVKFLSFYLNSLVEAGELAKAKNVYSKMRKIKNKPVEFYLSMANYFEMEEKHEDAQRILEAGLTPFPSSVSILLGFAKYDLREGVYKRYAKTLKKIRKLKAGKSPSLYAKFLEHMGMLSAIQKNNKKAAYFFKSALKFNESDELRSKLASLELGGGAVVESLIVESKIIELMKKTKKAMRSFNWEAAFLYAIEAADMNRNYIPAQLLLADLQIKRGFFKAALDTLLNIKNSYPKSAKVNFSLIEAYVNAYRLKDAQTQISYISQTTLVKHKKYPVVLAKYYQRIGDFILSLKWYEESIRRDGLEGDNYYNFAKTLLEFRKYNRSKNRLIAAISLDPLNVVYRSLYASILFELDGAEVGIGYLRKFMEEHGENERMLSEIAIFYYRNGQIKEFEDMRIEIERMPKKDATFYQFLIKSAELEGDRDSIIKYSKEFIKINPGDLKVRMKLAKTFFEEKRYKESIEVLGSVKERLASYPKANYFLAKVYIALGNGKEAIKAGNEEIKKNPGLEYGYYVVGEIKKIQKKWLDAEKNLEKALKINNDYVEALTSLCWINYGQNRLKKALRRCKRALKNKRNDPEIHKMLGYVYRGMGQSILAIEYFNNYLKLNPGATDRRKINVLMRQLKY